MFVKKPSFWLTSLAGVFMLSSLLAVNVQAADEKDSQREGKTIAGLENQSLGSSGFTSGQGLELPYVFPDLFKRRLVSTFSVGQVSDSGLTGGDIPGGHGDTYTEASAGFAYNVRRKRSEFVIDYGVSGRHYRRRRELDVVTHDLGLSHVMQLSPRLTWVLDHRYSFTPDFAGSLLRESLAGQGVFDNPVPPGGVRSVSMLVNPFPRSQSPTDGLDNTLRSIRMTNSTTANLAYQMSQRTSVFFQAGFERERYLDDDLFGTNIYSLAVGVSRTLSARTGIGLNYRAGRFEQSAFSGVALNHSIGFSVNRQLTPATIFSITIGPSLVNNRGEERIPLSPVLAHLLGRRALSFDVSQSFLSWSGSARLATQWHGTNLNLSYSRSISDMQGLGGAATSQSYLFGVGRRLTRTTTLSASVSFTQDDFIGLIEPIRLKQQGFSADLTRQLSPGVDFSAFFNYSRVIAGGLGVPGLNQQYGFRVSYRFPRMSGS